MKKCLFVVLVCSLFATASFAQKALGIRAGGLYGEFSYQQALSQTNRLEADLGFGWGGNVCLKGAYQWVAPLGTEGLSWFYGLAGGLGVGGGVNLAVGGQIGIDYAVPTAPISLSIDYRPMINIPSFTLGTTDLAIGLRYRF